MNDKKKLIEVALPLDAINTAAAREKSIRHGHPSTLHLWWARRPLAACRAVLFASLVDDPSAWPERFPDEATQEVERQRLFKLIEELVQWENSNKEPVLAAARREIARSLAWARGEEPPAEPAAVLAYLARYAPPVYDPFCGGGSIPLEAQRLGLEAHASDLNPVPVLITKALIEIPPRFAGRPPVNPESHRSLSRSGSWKGATGLAEDIRYYGRWMRDEAERRIGQLYPKVKLPKELGGGEAIVIAWPWARTVASPNPAAKGAHVPLARSFWLSTKAGKQAWVEPVVNQATMTYRFEIRTGQGEPRSGTVGRNGGICLLTGSPMPLEYIRAEGKAGRMGARLMAIVAEGKNGRIYLPPDEEQERIALSAIPPDDVPDTDLPKEALGFRVQNYGMTKHRHLFTNRQLVALTTFCDLVGEAREKVLEDSSDDQDYANAVVTYLAFSIGKVADRNSTIATWAPNREHARNTFTRQAISMTWDFAESNVFSDSSGNFYGGIESIESILESLVPTRSGFVLQRSATMVESANFAFSTDPPYYDNVPYADLSDFFYVWLRLCLQPIYESLFGTMLVPKTEELVADPFRQGGKDKARTFFEIGMGHVFERLHETSDLHFPGTIYYAFKQAEDKDEILNSEDELSTDIRASTGWETFLQGLVDTGWQVDGTWPMRTELGRRMRNFQSNALASSIILVCRPRPQEAGIASRRDFLAALKRELPDALRHLQKGNIAPVDLAQAAIGPGMAVFSRYARVLENDGSPMRVRTALALINQALDEVLAEQEGEFDADTRWALAWFDQYGFTEGPYGAAETLCTAKNTSMSGMVEAGILLARSGKVRLLNPRELPADWNPLQDARLTIWEIVHHLIRALDGSEAQTAELLAGVRAAGADKAEAARDLAYRLFASSERRKRAQDALGYNALVTSWPEIARLAQDLAENTTPTRQAALF